MYAKCTNDAIGFAAAEGWWAKAGVNWNLESTESIRYEIYIHQAPEDLYTCLYSRHCLVTYEHAVR